MGLLERWKSITASAGIVGAVVAGLAFPEKLLDLPDKLDGQGFPFVPASRHFVRDEVAKHREGRKVMSAGFVTVVERVRRQIVRDRELAAVKLATADPDTRGLLQENLDNSAGDIAELDALLAELRRLQ